MADNALKTTFTLSGDSEIASRVAALDAKVAQLFAHLGEAGKKTGEGIDKAGEGLRELSGETREAGLGLEALTRLFESMPGAVGEASEPLAALGSLFIALTSGATGLFTAISLVIGGFAGIAASAARATLAVENEAKSLGITADSLEGLQFAAAGVGIEVGAIGNLLERLQVKLGQARQEQEAAEKAWRATLPTLDQLASAHRGLNAAVDGAANAVLKSADSIIQANHAVDGSVKSVKTAKDSLADLQNEYARQLQAGFANPALAKQIDTARDAVTEAEYRLRENQKAAAAAIEDRRLKIIALRQEEQKRVDALNAEMKKQAPPEEQDPNKAIVNQLANFGSGIPDTVEQLKQFADRFNQISDKAKQAALAQSVLGKQWADFTSLLKLGSQGIQQQLDLYKKLETGSTEAENALSANFVKAQESLKFIIENLKDAFGNIVGQLFAPAFMALANALAENIGGVRNFAGQVVAILEPVFNTIGTVVGAIAKTIEGAAELVNGIAGTKLSPGIIALAGAFALLAPNVTLVAVAFLTIQRAITEFAGEAAGNLVGPILVGILAVAKAVTVVRDAFIGLSAAAAPWLFVAAAIAAVAASLYLVFANTNSLSEAIGRVFGEEAKQAFDTFVANFRAAVDQAVAWFNSTWAGKMVTLAVNAIASMVGAFEAGARAIRAIFGALGDSYRDGFLGTLIQSTIDALTYLWGWWVWLDGKIQAAWKSLKQLVTGGAEAIASAGGEAAATPGVAMQTGGQVQGPGGTDNVHVMATAGEFVHRVAAVQHYGTDFMARVNNLSLPRMARGGIVGGLGSMITRPRGYASGGLVGAAAAGGGMVPVDLSHDGEHFDVLAPAAVADRLVTHSRRLQMKSGGRKPDWFGGF